MLVLAIAFHACCFEKARILLAFFKATDTKMKSLKTWHFEEAWV